MKQQLLLIILLILTNLTVKAQRELGRPGGGPGQGEENQPEKKEFINPDVRAWHLIDDFSFSDTTAVDTLSNGYQIYNPIYKKSISNTYLGNLGSAYQSNIFQDRPDHYGFLFFNPVSAYILKPEDLYFYNTKTPYVNIGYHFGGPKQDAEEHISVLYTQNVNPKLNIGGQYTLNSSTGQYSNQATRYEQVKLFSSYKGENYAVHGAFMQNLFKAQENGGLDDPDENDFDFSQTKTTAVKLTTAQSSMRNTRLFINQSLNVGNISVRGNDSTVNQLPIGTIYHTLDIEQGKRVFSVNELEGLYGKHDFLPAYYNDSIQTRDTSRVTIYRNTLQLKFNEEANSFLKFGLRAFITNEYYVYKMATTDDNHPFTHKDTAQYHSYKRKEATTALGGQIFKNLGNNFWWKAGAKLYFQGYRAGDIEATGKVNSSFRVFNDTAGVFAEGSFYLKEPEEILNQYHSNHVQWKNSFSKEQTYKIKGGIRIPTKRFELSGGIHMLENYIYWNTDNSIPNNTLYAPAQSSDFIQILDLRLKQHFVLGRIHSFNEAVYQLSSNEDVVPLPTLALFNSTYYQNTLFNVLHFQLGFDVHYNTAYYAPNYIMTTGQFHVQGENKQKIGNYPFVDVFANIQLKRARIYVKFDHVNQGYPQTGFFHAVDYATNPRSLKFGVSWNFYD